MNVRVVVIGRCFLLIIVQSHNMNTHPKRSDHGIPQGGPTGAATIMRTWPSGDWMMLLLSVLSSLHDYSTNCDLPGRTKGGRVCRSLSLSLSFFFHAQSFPFFWDNIVVTGNVATNMCIIWFVSTRNIYFWREHARRARLSTFLASFGVENCCRGG